MGQKDQSLGDPSSNRYIQKESYFFHGDCPLTSKKCGISITWLTTTLSPQSLKDQENTLCPLKISNGKFSIG